MTTVMVVVLLLALPLLSFISGDPCANYATSWLGNLPMSICFTAVSAVGLIMCGQPNSCFLST